MLSQQSLLFVFIPSFLLVFAVRILLFPSSQYLLLSINLIVSLHSCSYSVFLHQFNPIIAFTSSCLWSHTIYRILHWMRSCPVTISLFALHNFDDDEMVMRSTADPNLLHYLIHLCKRTGKPITRISNKQKISEIKKNVGACVSRQEVRDRFACEMFMCILEFFLCWEKIYTEFAFG